MKTAFLFALVCSSIQLEAANDIESRRVFSGCAVGLLKSPVAMHRHIETLGLPDSAIAFFRAMFQFASTTPRETFYDLRIEQLMHVKLDDYTKAAKRWRKAAIASNGGEDYPEGGDFDAINLIRNARWDVREELGIEDQQAPDTDEVREAINLLPETAVAIFKSKVEKFWANQFNVPFSDLSRLSLDELRARPISILRLPAAFIEGAKAARITTLGQLVDAPTSIIAGIRYCNPYEIALRLAPLGLSLSDQQIVTSARRSSLSVVQLGFSLGNQLDLARIGITELSDFHKLNEDTVFFLLAFNKGLANEIEKRLKGINRLNLAPGFSTLENLSPAARKHRSIVWLRLEQRGLEAALLRAGIRTIGDLTKRSREDLRDLPGIHRNVEAVEEKLASLGLSLRP